MTDISDLDAILLNLNQPQWVPPDQATMSHMQPSTPATMHRLKSVRTTDPSHAYHLPEVPDAREKLHILPICPTVKEFDQPQLYALTPSTLTASIQDFDTLILDNACATTTSNVGHRYTTDNPSPTSPLSFDYFNMSIGMDLMESAMLSPYSSDSSNHSISDVCANSSSTSMAPTSPNNLLCSTQEAEESFIYSYTSEGQLMPMKTSQDYGGELLDEVNQISQHGFYFPQGTPCKPDTQDIAQLITFNDDIVNESASTIELVHATKLDRINTHDDVMFSTGLSALKRSATINPYHTCMKLESQSSIEDDTISYGNQITPAASPVSPGPDHSDEYFKEVEHQKCKTTTNYTEQTQLLQPHHNTPQPKHDQENVHTRPLYRVNTNINTLQTASKIRNCKRRLELGDQEEAVSCEVAPGAAALGQFNTENNNTYQKGDMRHKRVPPLTLKLGAIARVLEPIAVNTPELCNNMFDLETETMEFDLISFINSSQQEHNVMASSIECNLASNTTDSTATLSTPLKQEVASQSRSSSPASLSCSLTSSSSAHHNPLKRKRLEISEDSGSAQSDSSISQPSSVQPKRRGRPPKTQSTPVSPSVLENLNESDARYIQMRYKNNEASRRSRINRKDRELVIEEEAIALEQEHLRLKSREHRLQVRCTKLQGLLMKMAAV